MRGRLNVRKYHTLKHPCVLSGSLCLSSVLSGSCRLSVVLVDSQWFSVVLPVGSQWFSLVLIGFSVLLVGSHRFSVFS